MNTTKERILLVENDPEISDLISRQTLKPMGYIVEVVGAAGIAIQEASRFAPDVILANLNLPGLSGKDLLVALNSQGLEVPIIVIAPRGMESDVIQAFRLGATDFLYWPIREAEVVAAVERVLRQVRARREREVLARQLNHTNQELQRRVRELTTIFAIGKAVITAADQQSLFNKIMEGATFVTEADSGWLLVREERGKSFFLRACRNVPNDISIHINQPWDDGLSSLVALSGETFSIHGEALNRFKVSQQGGAALVVPVKTKSEVIGLLVVVRKASHPFSTGQQALLEAVADYASISLVNARLFKALEERVSLLQSTANTAVVSEQIEEQVLKNSVREIQQPLKSIKENVNLLLSKGMGRLNNEQRDVLEKTQQRLSSIQRIVEVMQSTSGKHDKTSGNHTNLNNVIFDTVQRLQPVARQGGITLSAELPGRPLIVLANETQISKVLEGLISNAIKFSLQGGSVIVRADTPNENTARVEVHDKGVGIDPKRLPLIFNQTQEGGTTAERFGGVGIGLPLINDIITKNGGKLWAESQPGQGAVFFFTLQTVSEV